MISKMKKAALLLVLISLSAYSLEALSIFHNFLSFGATHQKVAGLNDLNTLLSNHPLLFDLLRYFFIGLVAYSALAFSSFLAAKELIELGLPEKYGTLFAVLVLGSLLRLAQLANAAEFPHSNHDIPTNLPASTSLFALCLIFSLGPLLSLLRLAVNAPHKTFLVSASIAALFGISKLSISPPEQQTEQPNIIILGVDSLRPDHIGDGNMAQLSDTPFLDQQLSNSIWYKRSYTPMARTYPAWATLLTGQYPTQHGVRFSLTGDSRTITDNSIAKTLKAAGYSTLYAMDERRFSYIDERWGFEKIVGPKAGAADFALGSVHDISLINLLSLLPYADLLLPVTTHNRAIETLYSPQGFADKLSSEINKLPANKPAFVAVHLCLPHWPFGWKDKIAAFAKGQPELRHKFYAESLTESDHQLQTIWKGLEKKGLLENAVVIFMSDHGEGHGLDQDFADASLGQLAEHEDYDGLLSRFGHGTSLLALKQNEILLAIKDMRSGQPPEAKVVAEPASLLDILPTIADAANINLISSNGLSLLDTSAVKARSPNWQLFLESGFTVASMRKANTNAAEVAKQSMRYYQLTESGRLEVRDDLWGNMLDQKQYGLLTADGSILVNTGGEKPNERRWHLYNADEKKLHLDVAANSARVKLLKTKLTQHFGVW
jgi:arylsulfatase A-like enzyme